MTSSAITSTPLDLLGPQVFIFFREEVNYLCFKNWRYGRKLWAPNRC